jgi:hypothetical protein
MPASYGQQYYAVEIAVMVIPEATEGLRVSPLDFYAVCNGAQYAPDLQAVSDLHQQVPVLQSVSLQPGGHVVGYIAFQLPGQPSEIGWRPDVDQARWRIAVQPMSQ